MRRPALAAAALAAGLVPASAGAMPMEHGPSVSAGFSSFAPRELEAVRGETVSWHNTSVRDHTVTADDGSFDSGRIASRGGFGHTFTADGVVAYHCRLHFGMSGRVTVREILLDGAPAPVTPGAPVRVTGREAPGLGPVEILGPAGDTVATAAPDDLGHFAARFVPRTSGRYRARAGGRDSPAVVVAVRDLRVTARVAGRAVHVRVDPVRRGARILLQERSAEHFGWWPIGRGQTDARGRATFRLPGRAARRVRALLVAADGWTPLATGPAVTVRRISHRG